MAQDMQAPRPRSYVFRFNFLDSVTREIIPLTLHARGWEEARRAAHETLCGPRYRLTSTIQVPAEVWAARGLPCAT